MCQKSEFAGEIEADIVIRQSGVSSSCVISKQAYVKIGHSECYFLQIISYFGFIL